MLSIDRRLALSLVGTIGLASAPAAAAKPQEQATGGRPVAAAQSDTATVGDGPAIDPAEGEDILVTARLRTESLQSVPISAQVVGPQRLAQQNITSLVSLGQVSPSIRVQASGRSNNLYIRGTGSGESQSFDQSVGTFIDGIYHGRSRYTEAAFLDLDHLEILKGPQSIFFGNNAIAGAFNLVTEKPGKTLAGWARALVSPTSGENGGQYVAEGAVTLPLNDDVSVRVAGTLNGQRGYLFNVATREYAPKVDNAAARATVRYNPGEDIDITLKGEIGRGDNKGYFLRQTECPPRPQFTAAGFCALNIADGAPTGLDGSRFVANDGNAVKLRTFETVLTMNYRVGSATLTSITGYNGYRYGLDLDSDATARQLLNVEAGERQRQFSQELRLTSPGDRTVEYLAGAYFQADTLRLAQGVSYFFLTPTLSAPPPFAALRPYLPLGQTIDVEQRTRTYSAFGSVTWNATDAFRLTAGLRGSIVTKTFDWNLSFGTATAAYGGIVPLPAGVVPIANALRLGTTGVVTLGRNDHAVLPSASIQYDLDKDVMAYASYSRGHKAGGFSAAELSAIPANYPFEPEQVNAYEIGLKSQFLDRRVTLNLAAFRNDFSDLQVTIQGTNAAGALINFVRNAASSLAQGIEAEASWTVGPVLRIAASGTYLDSKFIRYPNAGPTYDQQIAGRTSQDLSGRPTLYAPRWSGNVTGTVTLPLGDDLRLTGETIAILSTRHQTYSTLDPLTLQPGYARLDARISLDSQNGRWGIDLIGRNLNNRIIRTLSGYQSTSLGSLVQNRQQLRNIALQARYRF